MSIEIQLLEMILFICTYASTLTLFDRREILHLLTERTSIWLALYGDPLFDEQLMPIVLSFFPFDLDACYAILLTKEPAVNGDKATIVHLCHNPNKLLTHLIQSLTKKQISKHHIQKHILNSQSETNFKIKIKENQFDPVCVDVLHPINTTEASHNLFGRK